MNSPSLKNVQRWMRAKIREGKTDSPPATEPVELNPQRSHAGEDRLPVYAGGYRARTRESLAESFEAIANVIGDKQFGELSKAYAQNFPSHDYNLSLMGRHLPEFLIKYSLTEKLPFLPDLAILEWCVALAFHAKLNPPVDPSMLNKVSINEWDKARFSFQPSVFVVRSSWPIGDIWETRAKPREEIDIDIASRPQNLLIFRDQFRVICKLVDVTQAEILQLLLDGQPLGSACSRIAAQEEHPIFVTEWFGSWIQSGLITNIEM